MKAKELPIFKLPQARDVLHAACRSKKITMPLLRALVDTQRDYLGMGRQAGITMELDTLFAEFLERAED